MLRSLALIAMERANSAHGMDMIGAKELRSQPTVTPAVFMHHVCFTVAGRRIFSEVDLVLKPSATFAVVGPRGSGKTSLLRLMVGLNKPSCGHIELFGIDLSSRDSPRARLSFISSQAVQGGAMVPASAAEIINSGLSGSRLGWFHDSRGADSLDRSLSLVGLEIDRNAPFRALSRLEQRLILIAKAISADPSFVALDDILDGLEVKDQKYLSSALINVCNQRRSTIVFTAEHSLGLDERIEVVRISDRKVINVQDPTAN